MNPVAELVRFATVLCDEHDFGSVEFAGEKCFWKIDYYNKALDAGSEDPADPAQTTRVLTIMLTSEYWSFSRSSVGGFFLDTHHLRYTKITKAIGLLGTVLPRTLIPLRFFATGVGLTRDAGKLTGRPPPAALLSLLRGCTHGP